MKNPFKKSSAVSTLINVGIGGAANVAVDYAWGQIDTLAGLGETTKNAIKIAAGAIGGSMVKNQYAAAALHGIATVGVSNLIASYLPGAEDSTSTTAGLPEGTIGRLRMGQRGFARRGRVAGVQGADFMSC